MTKKQEQPVDEPIVPAEAVEPEPEARTETLENVTPLTAKIELLQNYGGRRTNELRIAPGVYAWDDPALMGLAEYLIANGHARAL